MPRFSRPALRIVLFAVTRPWTTLSTAGVICAACILLAIFRLPISTDQNKLFSRDVGFFHDYLDFEEKFPENDAAYVVIEPSDLAAAAPAVERWTGLADAVAARLRGMPGVVRAVHVR